MEKGDRGGKGRDGKKTNNNNQNPADYKTIIPGKQVRVMVCLAIKLTEARIVALSNKGHKLNPPVVTLKPACQVKNMHKRLLLTRRSPLKPHVQNPPE